MHLTPHGSHFLLCTTKIKNVLVYFTLGSKNKTKRVMVLLILPLLQPKVARETAQAGVSMGLHFQRALEGNSRKFG